MFVHIHSSFSRDTRGNHFMLMLQPSTQPSSLQGSLTLHPPLPAKWPRALSNLTISYPFHIPRPIISPLSKNPSTKNIPMNKSPNPPMPKSYRNQVVMDWSSGEKSGRVSIDSHSLSLYASGPDRQPGDPVAIIIQGLTHSCKGWAAVQRLLKPIIRTYLYDRSGCGQSDPSPQKPSSTVIVAELDRLLKMANVSGPFILVAHSWGGVLSREFVHLRSDDVAGLVLVDANQELTLEVLDWRNPSMWAVASGVDHLEAIGVRRDHKLTDGEWAVYIEDEASRKHRKQAEAEKGEYEASFPVLAAKRQLHRDPPLLGDRPVCLILGHTDRDYERLYEAGVKAGGGSEEERAVSLRFIETFHEKDRRLQLDALSLSCNTRTFVAEESGHNVHLTNPEVIAEGVKWVLSQCMAGS